MSPETADDILSKYMEKMFLDGHRATIGNYTLAAVKCMCPEFSQAGGLALPRSVMSLRGWRRRARAHLVQRVPAALGEPPTQRMRHLRRRRYKHWHLVLRPREFNMASKTSEYDEVIVMNHPQAQFLNRGLELLRRHTTSDSLCLPMTLYEAPARFGVAAQRVRLDVPRPVLYMLH